MAAVQPARIDLGDERDQARRDGALLPQRLLQQSDQLTIITAPNLIVNGVMWNPQ